MGATGTEAPGPKLRRVLVAEDGSMFRTAMIRLLANEGFEVEAFPDGVTALQRLSEEGTSAFDLVIADVVMPELTGVDLVKRMRETLTEAPPVIFMSGDVRPALNDAPGTIGGDVILSKPFTADELFEAMDSVLR